MLQISQYIDFGDDLLFLFLVHLAVVEFFPDKDAPIAHPANLAHSTKTTYDLEKNRKDLNMIDEIEMAQYYKVIIILKEWFVECLPLPISASLS